MKPKFDKSMTQLALVFEEGNELTFDDFANQNGIVYWYASDLAMMLGYNDMQAISKAINKAYAVCNNLNIPIVDNFIQTSSPNTQNDLKMTRFACYLTVMNGNISNPKVAAAQAYFAGLAAEIHAVCQSAEEVDRVYLRGDISDREKSLSHIAYRHGVDNYAFFQNAGYRGMYNMNIKALKNKKGLFDDKASLLDYMNNEELAANIFRVTQTEAKIRNQNIRGQAALENAAETVGRAVRNVMIQNTGTAPEDLKLSQDKINKIQSNIKKTHKALTKHDKK
ncbi:DNA replication protein DnaD [Pasteurella multocida]|uniref:BRO family protein n=1 Tax=Pasteurella multocida TaxID=747 RepID=UPI0009F5C6FA|nr:BRO family protein [Pasteurella multocida]MEB3450913.1 DNA replication protein DnaD [Pasteurella multocida]MEB3452674.1 DNA replication protein DnaD [Pasteurella multocida]MEB3455090.1 DNA replication protein DnaD [Pasteurella multocida]MEB3460553.1 DNA replication protein DnaD [Pasteurella multocida]MEB3462410.1 DNA replication protein DnaD [Pasteurella multocida]